jgi:hypothetical protein
VLGSRLMLLSVPTVPTLVSRRVSDETPALNQSSHGAHWFNFDIKLEPAQGHSTSGRGGNTWQHCGSNPGS